MEHLSGLDVEDHVTRKMGDPIWRFLDTKHMTEERVVRIKKYNQRIEAQFGIKHEAAVFTETEKAAVKKLKKVLFQLLQHNAELAVPKSIIGMLGLAPAFVVEGGAGRLLSDLKAETLVRRQETMDFLQNDEALPEKLDEDKCLANLEQAFLSLVGHVLELPEDKQAALGAEITANLELEVLRHQFLALARMLKEQMKEAFHKDDRYCATGDEKYYLDLPGKEGEKVLMSEVRRFSRDFDGGQLTKTLTLKFERFTKEADINGITSFNNKLKACADKLKEKVSLVSLKLYEFLPVAGDGDAAAGQQEEAVAGEGLAGLEGPEEEP